LTRTFKLEMHTNSFVTGAVALSSGLHFGAYTLYNAPQIV